MKIHWIGCAPSNFRTGRSNHTVEAVVLHLIDGSQSSADATFKNPSNRVSAHYSVGKSGRVHQYVLEEDTAYHAGRLVNPTWPRLKNGVNPNLYTIGIEHEGRAHDEWTDSMYAASAVLLRAIAKRYWGVDDVPRERLALHREIRADKSCPGFRFDLDRLLDEARHAPPPDSDEDPSEGGGEAMMVRIRTAVNLRQGRPATSVPIVRVIPKDHYMNVIGTVTGQRYRGNDWWYRTIEDDYFWAGATDLPNPAGGAP